MTVPMFAVIAVLALVYITFAIVMAVTLVKGFKRGLYPTLLRLGIMLSSAVLAMIAVRMMHSLFSDIAVGFLMEAELSADLEELLLTSDSFAVLVDVLVGGLILPFVFSVLFVILEIIGAIVFVCTTRKLPKGNRYGGLGVGAVHGILFTLLLLFPLFAILSLSDVAMDEFPMIEETICESAGEEAADAIDLVTKGNVLHLAFGKNVVRGGLYLMTVSDLYGARVGIYDVLHDFAAVFAAIQPLSDGETDLLHLTDDDVKQLRELLQTVEDSPMLSAMAADVIAPATEAWSEGRPFADMESPLGMQEGKTGEIFTEVYAVLSDSDRTTVADNLETLFEAALVIENAMQEAGESGDNVILYICNHGEINELLAPFAVNPNMGSVVTKIMDLGVWALAQNMHGDIEEEDAYTEMLTTFTSIAEEAEMDVDAVTDEIMRMFEEHDMKISRVIVRSFAQALIEYMEETGQPLTEETMKHVLDEFSVKYSDEIAKMYSESST